MFGRRGQGAMEYLMTYGWAILVVMIVGIVMWQLGIFNLGSTSVTASGFAKLKPQLTSCKMTAGGVFSCLFTNGAGGSISINYLYGSIAGVTCATTATTTLPGALGAGPYGRGDNVNVGFPSCTKGAVGDAYALDVSIGYTLSVAGNSVTHNDTGKVRGPYEAG